MRDLHPICRFCVVLFAGIWAVCGSRAEVFTIADGDAAGLIAAIEASEANDEPDTINLATGGTYSLLQAYTGPYGYGLPEVRGELTINGNGAILERGANTPSFRILWIDEGADVTINDLTVRNGRGQCCLGGVGGIFAYRANLSLNRCTIRGNKGDMSAGGLVVSESEVSIRDSVFMQNNGSRSGFGSGGAITISDSVAVVEDSVIQSNQAGSRGAGIFVFNSSDVQIIRCTLESNSSASKGGSQISVADNSTLRIVDSTIRGGAGSFRPVSARAISVDESTLEVQRSLIAEHYTSVESSYAGIYFGGSGAAIEFIDGRSARIVNSTISGNSATREGGAIYVDTTSQYQVAPFEIVSSTFTGNTAGLAGDAIHVKAGNVTVRSSIIDSADQVDDVYGPITDLGFNLFADGSVPTHGTSMTGSAMLGDLVDNGGHTLTYGLLAGSPAIGASDCFGGANLTDQRGFLRPFTGGCDIGAFESDATSCPGDVALPMEQVDIFDLLGFMRLQPSEAEFQAYQALFPTPCP